MSFVKTLLTVGVGFAAAKGMEKYNQMGGMSGMRKMMDQSGAGNMADQLGAMADKMGLPGGSRAVKDMMGRFGLSGTPNEGAGMAGLGGLMAAMGGAASATGASIADLFGTMTEGTPVGQLAEENAKLMIRAMIQAAKADGEIDATEQAKILEHLADATPEEVAYVKAQLAAPLDPVALAQAVGDHSRAQVYAMSLMAITLDSQAEARYLQTLAGALGLDDKTRTALHQQMGVPAA